MSFEAISWAIKQDIPRSSEKFCLVMLANYANQDGFAYPSIERLSDDLSQDRKTVIKSLSSLEKMGIICDTGRRVGTTNSIIIYELVGMPTEKKYNYLYKITNPDTKEYYIGVRASSVHPHVDPYMGSGNWTRECQENDIFLIKEVLKIFETYEEARFEENKFFKSMKDDDGLCRNRQTLFWQKKYAYDTNEQYRKKVDSSTVFTPKQSQKRYTEPFSKPFTNPSDLEDPVLSIFANHEEPPESNNKTFWDEAVGMLMGMGVADVTARTFVGRCLKLANGDQSEILRVLEAAVANGVRDPIPYLSAALGGKKKKDIVVKNKQIANAFAELEAASERRKAKWREEYGTEYGVLPDTGTGGAKDHAELQPEPHGELRDVPKERGRSPRKVSARRVAQVIKPSIGNSNEVQVSANDF